MLPCLIIFILSCIFKLPPGIIFLTVQNFLCSFSRAGQLVMNSHKFCLSSNIFFSFSFFILVKHILHKMYRFNYFKVYHLGVLSIFIMFGNQHQYFQNFYHPKQKHCTHETALHSLLSEFLVISILLSVSTNLLILDTSFLKKCLLKSFAHFLIVLFFNVEL